ncbi:MAG: potassium channel family protein [Eubacteriales bacterium]
MNFIKRAYISLYQTILKWRFMTFYRYRVKRILTSTIKFYIPFVTLFVFTFSIIYYRSGGLNFINNNSTLLSFLDCFYFSTVTFFTLGFGDIRPITNFTKILVIIQEFLSFILLTLFSGFIVATFFIRRNDVFFDHKLIIRHDGNNFVLSFALMNQGAMFYDMNASLSLTLQDKNHMISRYSLIHNYTTWFKKVWYCEFDITRENACEKDYMAVYELLYMILSKQELSRYHPKFKLSIHGTDSETRDIAYYIKEYYLKGLSLKMIHNYLNHPKKIYSTFGEYSNYMNNEQFVELRHVLQNILFPRDQNEVVSVTGLFSIKNMHINQHIDEIDKSITVS